VRLNTYRSTCTPGVYVTMPAVEAAGIIGLVDCLAALSLIPVRCGFRLSAEDRDRPFLETVMRQIVAVGYAVHGFDRCVRGGTRRVRAKAEALARQLDRASSAAEVVGILQRASFELRLAAPEAAFGFPRAIATREDIEHWIVRMGPPPRHREETPALSALRMLFARARVRMNDLGPRRA